MRAVLFGCWAFLVALVLLVLGCIVFPLPMGDSGSVVPTAICYARDGRLVNPIYPSTLVDPTGARRFICFPPLFLWLLGAVLPAPTPRATFAVIGALRAVDVLLMAGVLWKLLGVVARKPTGWFPLAGAGLALVGAASSWMPSEGRSEALGTFWLLLGVGCVFWLRSRLQTAALGFLLGLLGATHPIGALLAGWALGLYWAGTRPWRQAVLHIGAAYLVSTVVFVGVLAASPNGLLDTVVGTAAQARTSVAQAWGDWNYWFLAGRTPFSGPLLLLTMIAAAGLWRQARNQIQSPALFTLFAVLFLVTAYYFSIRAPARNYNILMFSPFFYGLSLAWAIGPFSAPIGHCWHYGCQGTVLAVFGLTALGFVRYSALAVVFLLHGDGLDDARRTFQTFFDSADRPAAMLDTTWVLSERYERMTYCYAVDEAIQAQAPLIVAYQSDRHAHSVLENAGYTVILAHGTPHDALGPWMPAWTYGFGFLVYQCATPASSPGPEWPSTERP